MLKDAAQCNFDLIPLSLGFTAVASGSESARRSQQEPEPVGPGDIFPTLHPCTLSAFNSDWEHWEHWGHREHWEQVSPGPPSALSTDLKGQVGSIREIRK